VRHVLAAVVWAFLLCSIAGCPGQGAVDAGPDTLGPPPLACGEPVDEPAGLRCFSPLTFTLRAQNTEIDEACFACSEAMCEAEARAAFGANGLRVSGDAPAGDCADLVACAAACDCGDAACQYDCVLRIGCTTLNPLLGCLRARCGPSCLPTGACGDGRLASDEQCEPSLRAASCRRVGLADGRLACTRSCRWDSSECLRACCGDGEVTRGEQCDGEDLAGLSCEQLGYDGGTLGCSTICRIDTSACTGDGGRCGDGFVSSFLDERCDVGSSALGTCADLGFASGAIGCEPDCRTHDLSGCVPRALGEGGACADPLPRSGVVGSDGFAHFFGTTVGGSTREIAGCGATGGPEVVFEIVFPPGGVGGAVGIVDLDREPLRQAVLSLRESCDGSSEVACGTGASVVLVPMLSADRRYLLFVDGAEALPPFEVFYGAL
jgi:hypothetical protein